MYQPTLFTERTREFCLYAGVMGILMSAISIVHYFVAAPAFHWLLLLIIAPNVSVIIACFCLIKLNRWIIVMLAVCLLLFVLYFFLVLLMLKYMIIIFSPSALVLFIYTLGIFVYALVADLHSKLKENHETSKADAVYWNGKV